MIIKTILGWLTGGTLGRIMDTIDKRMDNETERERVKSDVVKEYLKVQVANAAGRGWWFPLFFIAPLGFWFTAVTVYSVLWCAGCAYPQDWTIAALPPPLNEWAGAIITTLFVGKVGQTLIGRLK